MAFKIKWTARVDLKFDKILQYLTTNYGEQVTKNFINKVYDFLDILSEFPEIGSIENQEKSIRGFTIVKQINIFYRIKGETIILLDFFDNRKNPQSKRF